MLSRRFVLAAACGVALSACGRESEGESPGESGVIRFAIQQTATPNADEGRWSPLLSDLDASTGLKVKASFVGSRAALVADLHRRRIDLALVSSSSALVAVRRADCEVFARTMPGAQTPMAAAVLVTGPTSRLNLERILKCDRTVSLGVAAGGRDEALLAADAYLFAPKGIGPARCFRDVRPAPPAELLAAVVDQKLDAAIVNLDRLGTAPGGDKTGGVRELWRSPPLPTPSLIWRRDLDPAIKEKLRRFFLTYGQGDAAQRQRLVALGLSGFGPADDSHLMVEREMDAARAWLQATASGDKAREAEARRVLGAVAAERQDLEARTRTPAGAQ